MRGAYILWFTHHKCVPWWLSVPTWMVGANFHVEPVPKNISNEIEQSKDMLNATNQLRYFPVSTPCKILRVNAMPYCYESLRLSSCCADLFHRELVPFISILGKALKGLCDIDQTRSALEMRQEINSFNAHNF